MAIEQYVNGFSTTLNGAINDTVTTLTLTSATGAPLAPFRAQIESEIIIVGARSGAVCSSIQRHAEGTLAVGHGDLTPITHILTRGGLLGLASVINQSGTVASAPAPTQEGNLYWPSDGAAVYRDTGTALEAWGPIAKFTDPNLAGLSTWVNQGSSSVATGNGMLTVIGAATGSGGNQVLLVKTAPATPYVITARLRAIVVNRTFQGFGLCFRESSTGKVHTLDYVVTVTGSSSAGGARVLRSTKYTNATTFSADYLLTSFHVAPEWFRLADDGVNRLVSVSPDGVNWFALHTIGRTDFLLTGANQVGLVISTENAATPNVAPILNLLSWRES